MIKNPQFVTPKGTFIYPKINKPDTKYKAEGEYSVKVRLPAAEAQELIKAIDAALEENYKTQCIEQKKKVLKKSSSIPYKEVTDDDGNPTGEIEFKFASKASYKDKTSGEVQPRAIPIVDAKKTPTTAQVWGGTEGKVAYTMYGWYTPALGTGLSLKLKAVQVLTLVSGSGGNFGAAGFDEEDGYVTAPSVTVEGEVQDAQELVAKAQTGDF